MDPKAPKIINALWDQAKQFKKKKKGCLKGTVAGMSAEVQRISKLTVL